MEASKINAKPRVRVSPTTSLDMFTQAGQGANAALRSWQTTYGEADSDLSTLQAAIRASYTLARENPVAISGVNTHVTETIGTGLELQARLDRDCLQKCVGLTEEQADEWEQLTETRFRMWAESPYDCDIEGQQTFYEHQQLAMRTELLAGDAMAVLPRVARKNSPYALRIQSIDPSRLCNKNGVMDSTRQAGGIVRDKRGLATHASIMKGHPQSRKIGNDKYTWDTLPFYGEKTGRQNVVHLFNKLQSGGSRGRPLLAPIISTVKQMGDYTDAEVAAAVVNAFFALFTQTSDTTAGPAFDYGDGPVTGDAYVNEDRGEVGAMSGTLVDLPAGRELVTSAPGRPNDKFDGFMQAMLKQVGMALDIPLEVLTKHFQSSYSAARAALLQFWKTVMVQRKHLSLRYCQPIYNTWLMEEIVAGRIEAPGFFTDPYIRRAWQQAAWIGPPRGMIRPDQEVEAELAMNAATVKSLSDITLQLTGNDWHTSVARQAREKRRLEKLGLDFALPDFQNRQRDDREAT